VKKLASLLAALSLWTSLAATAASAQNTATPGEPLALVQPRKLATAAALQFANQPTSAHRKAFTQAWIAYANQIERMVWLLGTDLDEDANLRSWTQAQGKGYLDDFGAKLENTVQVCWGLATSNDQANRMTMTARCSVGMLAEDMALGSIVSQAQLAGF
jgi:hypothetical protein